MPHVKINMSGKEWCPLNFHLNCKLNFLCCGNVFFTIIHLCFIIRQIPPLTRVNSMSHGERPKYPLPTVEDHDDMKTRMELTTKFNAIYDREWRMAYNELYDSLRWKDADCIYSLMRVVRVGFTLISYLWNISTFRNLGSSIVL